MSQSAPVPPERAAVPASGPAGPGRLRGLARRSGVRCAALGAAVLIAGGGALVIAGDHGRGGPEYDRPGYAADRQDSVRGERGGHEEPPAHGLLAPAALPGLPAVQAAQKAEAAVPGGRVESLRPVARQGGGRSWQAVVLGPDGVRHAVTVDGTDGTVTGNTITNSTDSNGNSGKK